VKNFSVCSPILPSAARRLRFSLERRFSRIQDSGHIESNPGSEFIANTETGYTGGGAAQATSGTRIRVFFQNVPSGLSVYVPISVRPRGLGERCSYADGFRERGLLGCGVHPVSGLAVVAISGGAGEAVYEVTVQEPGRIETYSVPVYVGAAGTILPVSGPMTATVSFAPVGAVSNIPDFASFSTALAASSFDFCLSAQTLPAAQVARLFGYADGLRRDGAIHVLECGVVLPPGLSISAGGTITGLPPR